MRNHIVSVCGQLRTKGSFGSVKRSGCGLQIRGFVRSPERASMPPPAFASTRRHTKRAPTYSRNSTGSPTVKDASRPTPQGLTVGDPVLQSGGVDAHRDDRA